MEKNPTLAMAHYKKKKKEVYKEKPFTALKIAGLCQRSEKYAAIEAKRK